MSEARTLIEKTINPPGITKKNRASIFSTISDVADIVRADALKAFNAHFPYLADSAKLEEHGNALLIPRLPDDNEKEYRDRVATASFFLVQHNSPEYIPDPITPRGNADTLDMNTAVAPMADAATISAVCNGTFFCDGSNRQSVIDVPMRIRIIKPLICDGTKKPTCSLCDGTIVCDGTYSGVDARYYRDEILRR
jgi:hypothetical protein